MITFCRLSALLLLICPLVCRSWGEEGHEVVGSIALHFLAPSVRARVAAILAGDSSGLTASTSLQDETTWADKLRDSDRNGSETHYRQTRNWHYVDIEIDRPDLGAACFGHPRPPFGTAASDGPPDACIVDKIEQFRRELHSPGTPAPERRIALQFLLHLVGDLHQPLHAADHHDKGGNDVPIAAGTGPPGNLHRYWDTLVVERLGADSGAVSARLIAGLGNKRRRALAAGSPTDWAWQSFAIARKYAYGELPLGERPIALDAHYEADATRMAALQLQRAGVRLARLLDEALR